MKKWIPSIIALAVASVCFTWTAQSFDDDKRRDGDPDREHREGHEGPKSDGRVRDKRGEREGGNEARMRHIGAAIEHLHAAGLRDWAEELAAHAKRMRGEREEREHREHREEGRERAHGEGKGVDQLRREVNELRNVIRELQQHLEKRR